MNEPSASDIDLTLALMMTPGVGARSVTRWLDWTARQTVPRESWIGRPAEALLMALPAGLDRVAAGLAEMPRERLADATRLSGRTTESGGQILLVSDADYPAGLRASLGSAAPPVLAIIGDLELLDRPALGVVGSRRPSEAGQTLARYCAAWAAREDIVLVSGGAQGIDLAAHETAVAEGGATVVVLPQGLLSFQVPPFISEGLEDGRAALVSEFVPNAPWTTHGAVTRNTTIAGLSRMACVIEPRETNGSAKTGRDALAQEKAVLVYGGISAGEAEKTLIAEGAAALLGESGRFEGTTLREAWETACQRANQAELF